jgi:23S rRNA pseudouridine955/2504/2580 synthase
MVLLQTHLEEFIMPGSTDQFHKVRYVSVTADHSGQRIDNFLIGLLKTAPRSLVYRLLRTGQVRVNKGRVKPSRKLQDGDVVRVPPVTLADDSVVHLPAALLQQVEQSVMHECDNWIVINKAPGLAVHGGTGVKFGVIDLLQKVFDDKRISLVHRLDRETSGCLVLAKSRVAAVHFQQSLEAGQVHKHYAVVVAGAFRHATEIDAPLAKNGEPDSGDRMVQVDHTRGKPALSLFRPREVGSRCSLVDVEIKTGRTHQIRVHAASVSHPVVGDDRYGDRAVNRWAGQHTKRMCLHAARIEFPSLPLAAKPAESAKTTAPDVHIFSCAEDPDWLALARSE